MSKAAVFLDRDGTINIEKQYLYRYEDWEWIPGAIEAAHEPTIWIMLGYLGVAVLIFAHVLAGRSISPARRVLGAMADIATLTWVMAFLGEGAAALFLVYVWVTLANGFRFGARYLVLSLALSALGFATSGAATGNLAPACLLDLSC